MNKVHQINEQFMSHEMLKKPMIITSFMLPPVWPQQEKHPLNSSVDRLDEAVFLESRRTLAHIGLMDLEGAAKKTNFNIYNPV
jgi:hypothetical protein